jgi:hypothetical protein
LPHSSPSWLWGFFCVASRATPIWSYCQLYIFERTSAAHTQETSMDDVLSGTWAHSEHSERFSFGSRGSQVQILSSRPVFTRSGLPGVALSFCSPVHVWAEYYSNRRFEVTRNVALVCSGAGFRLRYVSGAFWTVSKSKKPQPFQETTTKHSIFRGRLTQATNLRSTPPKACLFLGSLKWSTPTTAQPSERLNRETSFRARNISKALGAIRHKVPSFISTLINPVKTPPHWLLYSILVGLYIPH